MFSGSGKTVLFSYRFLKISAFNRKVGHSQGGGWIFESAIKIDINSRKSKMATMYHPIAIGFERVSATDARIDIYPCIRCATRRV
jgi:hypothetical protein